MAKKLMISIDEKLLDEIEAYAEQMYLNRSAAISFLCATSLQTSSAMKTLEKLLEVYEKENNKLISDSKS